MPPWPGDGEAIIVRANGNQHNHETQNGMVGPCGLEPQTSTVSISHATWERMRRSECKLHG